MIKFKKNSWHYKAANFVSSGPPEWMNFCEYVRHVLLGSFLFLVLVALITFVVVVNIIGIINAFQGKWGSNTLAYTLNIATIIVGFALFYVAFLQDKIHDAIDNYRARNGNSLTKKQPGFFSTWYRSVKNKFCPAIEFVDDNKKR